MGILNRQKNIFLILVIALLGLALLYILEFNFIIQSNVEMKQLKKQAQDLLLKNQLISTQASLYVANRDQKEMKDKFHLTEVKAFLSLESKDTQFSLR